jgi:hypothetical protein
MGIKKSGATAICPIMFGSRIEKEKPAKHGIGKPSVQSDTLKKHVTASIHQVFLKVLSSAVPEIYGLDGEAK